MNQIAIHDARQSARVTDLLGSGARTFGALLSQTSGLSPTDLLQALEQRRAEQGGDLRLVEDLISSARTEGNWGPLPQVSGLALPHPLDAEWRFSDVTLQELLDLAVSLTSNRDMISLVGVPSVAMAAAGRADDRRYVVKGERNVISDGVVRRTSRDVRFRHEELHRGQAAAVMVDPPWYIPQFKEMLGEASHACRIGGFVLVSVPDKGVRPGIEDDLSQIAVAASQAGLEFCESRERWLGYRTPLFELNAMRAAGVMAWLPEWRRGTLAVYRKRSVGKRWPASAKPTGFELTLEGVRIRLLADDRTRGMEMIPIHPGEIFPSVSARAPNRSRASLWTTGNRAFSAPYAETLCALLELSERRGLLPKRLDSKLLNLRNGTSIDTVESLIQTLIELAGREVAEALSLLGVEAWERSANDARFLNAS